MKLEKIPGTRLYPVSVSEAKANQRIEHNEEDSLIESMLSAAIEQAESYINGYVFRQQLAIYFDSFSSPLLLGVSSIASVDQVEYSDRDNVTQVLPAHDYDVDLFSGELAPIDSWPSIYEKYNAVKVTVTVGYGASELPTSIKHAVLLMFGHLYENREATTPLQLKSIPFGFRSLLDPFREGIV